MKKLEDFKKSSKTVSKEEVNLIQGGNVEGSWQWIWFEPIYTWLYVWTAGV